MGKEEFVSVVRHTLAHRIWHWVLFVSIGLLVLTGVDMYFGLAIFGGLSIARSWHMVFAFLVGFWAYPVFVYFYWVTGELKDLVPVSSDLTFFAQMAKSFLGLSANYPEHSTYDVKAGEYYRKYNPGQKAVYGGILLFLFLQGLTGFVMFWPDTFGFLVSAFGGIANIRALHLVLLYVILSLVALHIYMAVIPQNWEALKSMFIGKARERVHKSS